MECHLIPHSLVGGVLNHPTRSTEGSCIGTWGWEPTSEMVMMELAHTCTYAHTRMHSCMHTLYCGYAWLMEPDLKPSGLSPNHTAWILGLLEAVGAQIPAELRYFSPLSPHPDADFTHHILIVF